MIAAEKVYRTVSDEFLAAAQATKWAKEAEQPTEALVLAAMNKHPELVAADRKALAARRAATAGPTRNAVLHEACRQAGVASPKMPHPDEHDEWEGRMLRLLPIELRAEHQSKIKGARIAAEDERLYFAVDLLSMVKRHLRPEGE